MADLNTKNRRKREAAGAVVRDPTTRSRKKRDNRKRTVVVAEEMNRAFTRIAGRMKMKKRIGCMFLVFPIKISETQQLGPSQFSSNLACLRKSRSTITRTALSIVAGAADISLCEKLQYHSDIVSNLVKEIAAQQASPAEVVGTAGPDRGQGRDEVARVIAAPVPGVPVTPVTVASGTLV